MFKVYLFRYTSQLSIHPSNHPPLIIYLIASFHITSTLTSTTITTTTTTITSTTCSDTTYYLLLRVFLLLQFLRLLLSSFSIQTILTYFIYFILIERYVYSLHFIHLFHHKRYFLSVPCLFEYKIIFLLLFFIVSIKILRYYLLLLFLFRIAFTFLDTQICSFW